MITRDVSQLQIVPAFRHQAMFVACGATNLGTCTCDAGIAAAGSTWFPGYVIDRLGLTRLFNSVAVAPIAWAEVRVSDENARVQSYAVGVGLQHTCTTGGTWADLSTEEWIVDRGFWRQTTATATACAMYTAIQRDTADTLGGNLTTTTSTADGVNAVSGSSSTGYAYYSGPPAVFDLTKAKRYLRVLVRPVINSTACDSGRMHLSAAAIFGEPSESPAPSQPVKRILVTTGCST